MMFAIKDYKVWNTSAVASDNMHWLSWLRWCGLTYALIRRYAFQILPLTVDVMLRSLMLTSNCFVTIIPGYYHSAHVHRVSNAFTNTDKK